MTKDAPYPEEHSPSLPNVETLRRMVEAEQRKRTEACQQAVEAVLLQHRCELFAQPQVTADGRLVAVVGLRAAA